MRFILVILVGLFSSFSYSQAASANTPVLNTFKVAGKVLKNNVVRAKRVVVGTAKVVKGAGVRTAKAVKRAGAVTVRVGRGAGRVVLVTPVKVCQARPGVLVAKRCR